MLDIYLFDEGGDASAESSAATETSSEESGVATQEEEKLYTKTDMSEAIKGRVKGLKARETELTEMLDKYKPISERLSVRYGTSDLDELVKMLDNDDSWLEAEAAKRGLTKEATKTVMEVEREKRALAQREAEHRAELQRIENVTRWRAEERELRKTYPNFNLDEEFDDPRFSNLLFGGVSVEDAYMALHAKDIVRGGVQYAYEKGREAQADSIRANADRPLENGVSSKPAVNTKIDVSKLTNAELDAIEARVRAGERITLR